MGEGWAAEVAGVDKVRADLLEDQLQFDPRVSWRERGIATALGRIAGESGRVEDGGRGMEGGGWRVEGGEWRERGGETDKEERR